MTTDVPLVLWRSGRDMVMTQMDLLFLLHSGSEVQEANHRTSGKKGNGAAHEQTPNAAHVHQKGPRWRLPSAENGQCRCRPTRT